VGHGKPVSGSSEPDSDLVELARVMGTSVHRWASLRNAHRWRPRRHRRTARRDRDHPSRQLQRTRWVQPSSAR